MPLQFYISQFFHVLDWCEETPWHFSAGIPYPCNTGCAFHCYIQLSHPEKEYQDLLGI